MTTALGGALYAAWLLRWPLAAIAAITTAALAADRHHTTSPSAPSTREDHLS